MSTTPIRARLVENDDGTQTVRANCRDCGQKLFLPFRADDYPTPASQEFALKWADLLVCTDCYQKIEQGRLERQAGESQVQRVRRSGIPDSFKGLRFEDMDTADGRGVAVSEAWAWADAEPRSGVGILLHGPPGTGKTRLAGTAVWQRLQRFSVSWCSVAHLIAALGASFSDEDRRLALSTLMGDGALVLDDLDKVRPSEQTVSQLFVAVDRRVAAGAPLFVTSNARPDLLVERFGGPLTSRLLGYCRVLELGGRDRRLGGSS